MLRFSISHSPSLATESPPLPGSIIRHSDVWWPCSTSSYINCLPASFSYIFCCLQKMFCVKSCHPEFFFPWVKCLPILKRTRGNRLLTSYTLPTRLDVSMLTVCLHWHLKVNMEAREVLFLKHETISRFHPKAVCSSDREVTVQSSLTVHCPQIDIQ